MNLILKQALLGTANPVPMELNEPFKQIFSSLQIKEREKEFLLTAASLYIYQQAGYQPVKTESGISKACDEKLRECSPFIARLVKSVILENGYPEYIREISSLMEKHGQRLPYDLLPVALDAPNSIPHESIFPILGERGLWLSQFKEEWHWVKEMAGQRDKIPDNIEKVWETDMTHPQRVALLRKMRKIDPAKARSLVELLWSKEKAENRQEFIGTFEVGLSREDEPFLNKALSDRSGPVGDKASAFLARLGNCDFIQKICDYADTMISYGVQEQPKKKGSAKSAKSAKANKMALTIDPPQELGSDWEKLSMFKVEEKGKRAVWLTKTITLVDPAHWEKQFELTPHDIIQAAEGNDWQETFITGLSQASLLYKNIPWQSVLWDFWFDYECDKKDFLSANRRMQFLSSLLFHLPPEEKKERLWKLLDIGPMYGVDWNSILEDPSLWEQMGEDFLDRFKEEMESIKPEKNKDIVWNSILPGIVAFNLPSHFFGKALGLDCHFPEGNQWIIQHCQEWYRKFLEIVETRKRILEEIGS